MASRTSMQRVITRCAWPSSFDAAPRPRAMASSA
jgi:hypothetical protein